jgi:hypothetical protein
MKSRRPEHRWHNNINNLGNHRRTQYIWFVQPATAHIFYTVHYFHYKHCQRVYLQCAFPPFTQATLQAIPVSQKQNISYKTYLYNGDISNVLCPPLKQQDLVILAQFYVRFVMFFFDLSSYHAENTVCLNYKEQFRRDTAYLISSACYFFR